MKIDVVNFDGTNTFRLWRCEVFDALYTQNWRMLSNYKRGRHKWKRRFFKKWI